MYKTVYSLADIKIGINYNDINFKKNLESFNFKNYLISKTVNTDIDIDIILEEEWIERKDNSIDIRSIYKAEIDKNTIILRTYGIYGRYNFIEKKGTFKLENSKIAISFLLRVVINYSLPFFNGLYLHASSVFNEKNGIIATGVSGAGKTTFAKTVINQGYKVLHDELTAIKYLNNKFYIFSLPSIDDILSFENGEKIELTHLFFLGKSKIDNIEIITKIDFYKKIMKMVLSFTKLPPIYYPNILKHVELLWNSIDIKTLNYNPKSLKLNHFI